MKFILSTTAIVLLISQSFAHAQTTPEPVVATSDEVDIEYLPGYDFSEALITHILTEQAISELEKLIRARQTNDDQRSTLILQKLDVMRVTHPGFDKFELEAPDQDIDVLRGLQDSWQALEKSGKAFDGEDILGSVQRTLLVLSDYLDQTYLPRITALAREDDLASSGASASELYMNFLGFQSMLIFDVNLENSTVRLFDALPNLDEFLLHLADARQKLEPVRLLSVEVRKETLTEEKQANYKEQLAILADDIKVFSAFLRSSASDG